MLKRFLCSFAVLFFTLTLAGCLDYERSEPETVASSPSGTQENTEPLTEPDPFAEYRGINPLTGESGYNEAACGKRPVAVMVNNLKDSLPQYGIEQADIIFELPVEGGITRLMAVYADYTDVPDVCSVRSCRYYYPLLCLGMDAIYCHWGADQTIALETLERTGIDHFDGEYEKDLFFRDQDRLGNYASEHTGYLKGSELPDKIEREGVRTDLDELHREPAFVFTGGENNAGPGDMSANTVDLRFSSSYYSTFTYDAANGVYLKQHSGNPHIDGRTNNQLSFDNIFVLQTDIHKREDGYLMDVRLSGGKGYYISKGSAREIIWEKKGESLPIKIYERGGKELVVNTGESYIGIIGSDKTVTIQ